MCEWLPDCLRYTKHRAGISWLWYLYQPATPACCFYYIVPQVDTSNLSSWNLSLFFSGPWCVWRTERRAREHEKAAWSTKKDARTAGTTPSTTRPSGGTAGHAAKCWTSHSGDGWHWCGKHVYFMLLEVRIVPFLLSWLFLHYSCYRDYWKCVWKEHYLRAQWWTQRSYPALS